MDQQKKRPAPQAETEAPEGAAKPRGARPLWKYVLCPLAVLLAVLGVFALVVNLSPKAATAAGKLPLIGGLSKALRFSKERSYQVDNDYVQVLDLAQTGGEDRVKVDFLVVDRQTLTVFFHLETDRESCYLGAKASLSDGTPAYELCDYCVQNEYTEGPLEGLQSLTMAFPEAVPETLQLRLSVVDAKVPYEERVPENYDFQLRFDPSLTAPARHCPQDAVLVLDEESGEEKRIHVTGVDVYTDHVCISVEGDPEDKAWIEYLDYCVKTPEGLSLKGNNPRYDNREDFYDGSFLSCEADGGLEKAVLRVDSVLLNKASSLKLEIVEFDYHCLLDPNCPYVDLVAGTAERLPDGVELVRTRRDGDDWLMTFRCGDEGMQDRDYYEAYDALGRVFGWVEWINVEDGDESVADLPELSSAWYQTARLRSYPYDGVYLTRDLGTGVYFTEKIPSVVLSLDGD